MKKVKYLFALLFIGSLLLTGCGKKESNVKTDKGNSIKSVVSMLDVKYDDIDTDGDYFYALTGDSITGNIDFFNNNGKKLGSLNLSKIDPKIVPTLDIEELSDNYYIVSYTDVTSFKTIYAAYSYGGKELVKGSDMEVLTDNYILATTESDDDIDIIYSSNGKEAFSDVKSVKTYNDTYISFKQNDVSKIIDNNGKELLSGYSISKVVTDDNDEIKYMIIRSDSDSVYNYYNVKDNSKKGDAFTNYTEDSKTGNIIITKKVNSDSVKFILNDNGEQVEYIENSSSNKNYYEDIKDKIDLTKFAVFSDTVKSANQNYILVDSLEENKFGVLDISKGEFTELGTYKENSLKRLTLNQFIGSEDNQNIIFSVSCSTNYCNYSQQYIYDFTSNKLLATRGENETSIRNMYVYDNNYVVVSNASSSNNDSGLFVLLDNEGNKVFESDNYIEILGQKVNYYTSEPKTTGNINLYNLNDKKVVNAKGDDAYSVTSMSIQDKKLRYYNSDDKINFISDDGTINSVEGEYQSYDDVGIYLVDGKKLVYYNAFTNKTSSYTPQNNESNNGSNGREMIPYRDAFFINNSYDMTFKVVNSDGKDIISKKNLQIYKIAKNDDGNILVYVKDNNDKIGVYIAK